MKTLLFAAPALFAATAAMAHVEPRAHLHGPETALWVLAALAVGEAAYYMTGRAAEARGRADRTK